MPQRRCAKPKQVNVLKHRDRMQPTRVSVPDVQSASFRKTAHRQSLKVSQSARVREDQAFIDVVSDWQDE